MCDKLIETNLSWLGYVQWRLIVITPLMKEFPKQVNQLLKRRNELKRI